MTALSSDYIYVKVPENHIVIDFDIPDKDGNKYYADRFLYSDNSVIQKSKLALSSIYGSCVMQRIEKVIFNEPATIVFWGDGTKIIVKCDKDDIFDPEKGLAMAISKKILGTNKNRSNYYDIFKKYLKEYEQNKKNRTKENK